MSVQADCAGGMRWPCGSCSTGLASCCPKPKHDAMHLPRALMYNASRLDKLLALYLILRVVKVLQCLRYVLVQPASWLCPGSPRCAPAPHTSATPRYLCHVPQLESLHLYVADDDGSVDVDFPQFDDDAAIAMVGTTAFVLCAEDPAAADTDSELRPIFRCSLPASAIARHACEAAEIADTMEVQCHAVHKEMPSFKVRLETTALSPSSTSPPAGEPVVSTEATDESQAAPLSQS